MEVNGRTAENVSRPMNDGRADGRAQHREPDSLVGGTDTGYHVSFVGGDVDSDAESMQVVRNATIGYWNVENGTSETYLMQKKFFQFCQIYLTYLAFSCT